MNMKQHRTPERMGYVQGQLSIQEEEFVDNILRQEPAADC